MSKYFVPQKKTAYYVVQNRACPGTEFQSWLDAANYLRTMRALCPADWQEARILGPDCDSLDEDALLFGSY